jgi:hypothetical protein
MNFLRWARIHWDRTAGGALIALGGLCIVLGWNRVSGEALTAQQVPYVVSGGIGGLFLLGLGGILWLSADLRDEWRKLDDIERRLPEAPVDATPDPFAADDGQGDEPPTRARPSPLRARAGAGKGA